MSNFRPGDTCYCIKSGNGPGTTPVPKGTRGEVLAIADADFVVVRWELPGCQFVTPVAAISEDPPDVHGVCKGMEPKA